MRINWKRGVNVFLLSIFFIFITKTILFGYSIVSSLDYPISKDEYIPGSHECRKFLDPPNHLGDDINPFGNPFVSSCPSRIRNKIYRQFEGYPIKVIGDGRIAYYGPATGYGELVAVVEHDFGKQIGFTNGNGGITYTRYILSIYGHLRKNEKRGDRKPLQWKINDEIKEGEIVGYVNDRNHNGDGYEHLHLGIRLDSEAGAKIEEGKHPRYWFRGYDSFNERTGKWLYRGDFANPSSVIDLFTVSPWPMFGHDAQHTGQSTYIGPKASHLSWPPLDLRNGGVESGSPVLDAEGVLYVNEGYGRNTLYAISSDGTVKWQANTDVSSANSSAIGIDGTIYTATHLGNSDHLWGFDKSSGNYIWSFPISAGSTEPIVSPEGIIYIGDKTGLYAFNADRTLKWKRDISSYYGMVVTPAIANDGSIIIVSMQQGFSTLYSVDKENLKINWSLDINDSFYIGFPVIHSDGTIYVYGNSGNLYSVSVSGQLANNKWPLKISFSNWSTLAIGVDGTVYVGTTSGQGDGALYALYPSGDVKWVYPTGMVVGPPAIDADGTIYFGSGRYPERNPGDSRITALKPDGSLLWEYFTTPLEGCETFYPAIAADGTLYVSACGFLYAFKD